jgi:hypothetical protein
MINTLVVIMFKYACCGTCNAEHQVPNVVQLMINAEQNCCPCQDQQQNPGCTVVGLRARIASVLCVVMANLNCCSHQASIS